MYPTFTSTTPFPRRTCLFELDAAGVVADECRGEDMPEDRPAHRDPSVVGLAVVADARADHEKGGVGEGDGEEDVLGARVDLLVVVDKHCARAGGGWGGCARAQHDERVERGRGGGGGSGMSGASEQSK